MCVYTEVRIITKDDTDAISTSTQLSPETLLLDDKVQQAKVNWCYKQRFHGHILPVLPPCVKRTSLSSKPLITAG